MKRRMVKILTIIFALLVLAMLAFGQDDEGERDPPATGGSAESPSEEDGVVRENGEIDESRGEMPLLTGRVVVDHPNFRDHRFVNSYVYSLDRNEYIRLAEDGTFQMEIDDPGKYSFKTYVPGFRPSFGTVEFPERREFTIPVELQVVQLATREVSYGIPAYLYRLNESLSDETVSEERQPDRTAPVEEERPGINFGEFLRGLFRRDGDRE